MFFVFVDDWGKEPEAIAGGWGRQGTRDQISRSDTVVFWVFYSDTFSGVEP
jgi:hypothetical protein